MHHAALTDPHALVDGHPRHKQGIRPDPGAAHDDAAGTDHRARPDLDVGLDDRLRPYRGVGGHPGGGIDDSRRVDAGSRPGARVQDLRDSRKGRVRVGADQRRHRAGFGRGRVEDHGGRLRVGEMAPVAGIGQERNRAGTRGLQRGHGADHGIRIPGELEAESDRQLAEGRPHCPADARDQFFAGAAGALALSAAITCAVTSTEGAANSTPSLTMRSKLLARA